MQKAYFSFFLSCVLFSILLFVELTKVVQGTASLVGLCNVLPCGFYIRLFLEPFIVSLSWGLFVSLFFVYLGPVSMFSSFLVLSSVCTCFLLR